MLRRIVRALVDEFDLRKTRIALPCLVVVGLAFLFGTDPPGSRLDHHKLEALAAAVIVAVGLFAMYYVLTHGEPPERDD